MQAKLISVPSTVHLKMKYYTSKSIVATLYKDIEATKRYCEVVLKGMNSINAPTWNKPTLPNNFEEPNSLPSVDSINLDSCFSRDDLKDKK